MSGTSVTWKLAGAGGLLAHRAVVGMTSIDLQLGLSVDDPTQVQEIQAPRGYLVSSLIRTLKVRPVKGARPALRAFDIDRLNQVFGPDQDARDEVLTEAAAEAAWTIELPGWQLAGINGRDGVALAIDQQLWPLSNSDFFKRLCSHFGSY